VFPSDSERGVPFLGNSSFLLPPLCQNKTLTAIDLLVSTPFKRVPWDHQRLSPFLVLFSFPLSHFPFWRRLLWLAMDPKLQVLSRTSEPDRIRLLPSGRAVAMSWNAPLQSAGRSPSLVDASLYSCCTFWILSLFLSCHFSSTRS